MIPWRSTVGEGRVAAVDVLQPGGQVPLKDIFEDGTPWCSFWDDVNGGRLKTDKVNEARKVELDWLHHHRVVPFAVKSLSACSTLVFRSRRGHLTGSFYGMAQRDIYLELPLWSSGEVNVRYDSLPLRLHARQCT